MVNMFKKIILVNLFLFVISLIGCNSTNTKNQQSDEKINNFNFVFKYGVDAKNKLDTIKGKYVKDMITEGSITIDLKLSNEEMNTIYSEMNRVNILNYPENFESEGGMVVTPFETYSLRVIIDGKEKNIYWKDQSLSKTKEAVQLRELFERIQVIISNKEEYKKLPEAQGGYY